MALAIIEERITIRAALSPACRVDMISRVARGAAHVIIISGTTGCPATATAASIRTGFTVGKHDTMSRANRGNIQIGGYGKNKKLDQDDESDDDEHPDLQSAGSVPVHVPKPRGR